MDERTYQAKCEAVFRACRNKLPARRVVPRTSLIALFRIVHVAYYLLCTACVAGMGVWVESWHNLPGTILGTIGAFAGFIIAGCGDYVAHEAWDSTMGFILASRLLKLFGITSEMEKWEASNLREWCQKYPDFVPILAQWGAKADRGSVILGHAHAQEISRAVYKLGNLADAREVFRKEEQNRAHVQDVMESCGISSAIEAKLIERSTPQATAPERHSRL